MNPSNTFPSNEREKLGKNPARFDHAINKVRPKEKGPTWGSVTFLFHLRAKMGPLCWPSVDASRPSVVQMRA